MTTEPRTPWQNIAASIVKLDNRLQDYRERQDEKRHPRLVYPHYGYPRRDALRARNVGTHHRLHHAARSQ